MKPCKHVKLNNLGQNLSDIEFPKAFKQIIANNQNRSTRSNSENTISSLPHQHADFVNSNTSSLLTSVSAGCLITKDLLPRKHNAICIRNMKSYQTRKKMKTSKTNQAEAWNLVNAAWLFFLQAKSHAYLKNADCFGARER